MAIGTDEDARFDYVVVGAGTAGCLLADRLSATGASVCVLEAGGATAVGIFAEAGTVGR